MASPGASYRTGAMSSLVASRTGPAAAASAAPARDAQRRDAPPEAPRDALAGARGPRVGAGSRGRGAGPLHVVLAGPPGLLDVMSPGVPVAGLEIHPLPLSQGAAAPAAHAPGGLAGDPRVGATLVLDPAALAPAALRSLPGVTLGLLTDGLPAGASAEALAALSGLDRIASFDPALTGEPIGDAQVWRAIPPPVSDLLFAEVRPLHGAPRVMSLGRSTPHREAMLLPSKHHHDLLQLVSGVHGPALRRLMREYDAGVYVPRRAEGGFGQQACMHLAAGQLLLAGPLAPAHGLERDIDYLQFGSGEELVWMLERVRRFPEMHDRVRVRGRMKAEQFRASRVLPRILHDLLADVSAFGRSEAAAR
jgi:hypothetical protein